ncbi:MAG: hypothetical protein A2X23_05280 [Chloroflexi bacterium GWC2_73_18]|nr:MAG: hypothetical protein A2X23_05280 [Chloroflexi bacterium GWC2_73_18]
MPIKLPFLPRGRELPRDLWTRCPGCEEMLYNKHLAKDLWVCARCGHHFRLRAEMRLELLLDPGSFAERDAGLESVDPLHFVDLRPYPERIASAQANTGLRDGAVWGIGAIGGTRVAVCVMDFAFMGGSMGSVVGEKVTRAVEAALAERIPLVVVSASGGARMQEGTLALMQLAKTCGAVERLRAAGVPYLSVMTDPTTGGVYASFAALGDVNLAEPNALIGFAGARVAEGTIAEELPAGFQRAEFLLERGFVDRVVPRAELRQTLATLLGLLRPRRVDVPVPASSNGSAFAGRADAAAAAPVLPAERGSEEEVWEHVQKARDLRRPHTRELVEALADAFVELHGDRLFRDDPAIVGGLARFAGRPVVVVGHQKGADTSANIHRNFGMPHPEGYRKAQRLFALAERFGLPVLTFVDTPGAFPGPASEERSVAEAIARSIAQLSVLRTPIVVVISGEGGSGGALAIAVGDVVLALENAIYSVISPEGCAAILWRSRDASKTAAAAMRLTAGEQLLLGVVDEVIPEPSGGTRSDDQATLRRLRESIGGHLERLERMPVESLLTERYRRYRELGSYRTVEGVPGVTVPERPSLADRIRQLFEVGRATLGVPEATAGRPQPIEDEEYGAPLREEV